MKRTWFLPQTLDVIGMLRAQAAVTIEGIEALVEWARGDPSRRGSRPGARARGRRS